MISVTRSSSGSSASTRQCLERHPSHLTTAAAAAAAAALPHTGSLLHGIDAKNVSKKCF